MTTSLVRAAQQAFAACVGTTASLRSLHSGYDSLLALIVPNAADVDPIRILLRLPDCCIVYGSGASFDVQIQDQEDVDRAADLVAAVIRGHAAERYFYSEVDGEIMIAPAVRGCETSIRGGDDVTVIYERTLPAWT